MGWLLSTYIHFDQLNLILQDSVFQSVVNSSSSSSSSYLLFILEEPKTVACQTDANIIISTCTILLCSLREKLTSKRSQEPSYTGFIIFYLGLLSVMAFFLEQIFYIGSSWMHPLLIDEEYKPGAPPGLLDRWIHFIRIKGLDLRYYFWPFGLVFRETGLCS